MKILSDDNKSANDVCDEFVASKHGEFVKNAISNEIYYVSIVYCKMPTAFEDAVFGLGVEQTRVNGS